MTEKPDAELTENVLESGDEASPKSQKEDEEFPIYKWIIVAALFMQSMALWGINTSIGVILSFYNANDYFHGASPYAYAFLGGLSIGCAFLVAPLSNYLTSRYGFKLFMWLGIVLVVLGQCCAGLKAEIWLPILTQGIMFGTGMGLTYIPSLPLVSQYHTTTRGLANGIVSAGSGLGALIWSLETRAAIESIGLKYSFVINGLLCLLLLVPSTAVLRSRTEALNAKFEPLRLSLFRDVGFCLVAVYAVFVVIAYIISIYSLATFATQGLGLSQSDAATAQALLAVGQMLGRPSAGAFWDRVGVMNGTIIVTSLSSILILCFWMFVDSFAALCVFAVLDGAFGGLVWASLPPLLVRVLSIQQLGSALALVWVTLVAPSICSEAIALGLVQYSRDQLGRTRRDEFLIAIGFTGGAYAVGALALVFAKRRVQESWRLLEKC